MNFLKRVWLIIASTLNDLLSKAEDPEKIMNQIVSELGQNMQEIRLQIANALKEHTALERKLAQNVALVTEYDRKAILALKNGDEELAIEALRRKEASEQMVAQLEVEVGEQNRLVDTLRENFKTLENRVDEARDRKTVLVSQAKRAEARLKTVKAVAGMDRNGQLLEAFDRMAGKIADTEDMAVAVDMVTSRGFNEKMSDLEKESKARQKLNELKNRLGLEVTPATVPEGSQIEKAQIIVAK